MIYLYAITEPGANVPDCPGLEGAGVLVARVGELTALYSEHEQLEARPVPETIWRHEQVVEAAMQAGPALPARFGTVFADEHALHLSLEREAAHLRGALERVRGCVELAVRVGEVAPAPSTPAASDGRGYLEARLSERQHQRTIVSETLAPLSELAVRAQHDTGRSERELVCASYLVKRDLVDRFSDEVSLVAEHNPDLWLSCTGPWPPYSFAGLEDAA